MTNSWREELIKADKNILSVLKKTIALKSTSRLHVILIAVIFIVFLTAYSSVICSGSLQEAQLSTFKAIEKLLPLILSYGIGVLGFLIAGFAILASSNHGPLFEILAKSQYPNEQVSILQFLFYNFISSIVLHLFLISFVFVIVLISQLTPIYPKMSQSHWVVINVNFFTLFTLILFQGFALLNVKSFVWNLYSGLLMTVATESKIRENQ